MKKICLYLFLFLFAQTISAQVTVEIHDIGDVDTVELREMFPPTIEEIFKQQNITLKVRSPYTLTNNSRCLPCDNYDCNLRHTINSANASLTHKDNNCEVYMKSSYKNLDGNPESIPDFMGGSKNMTIYNRIKSDLDWQVIKMPRYANKCEIDELKMLVTNYPAKLAKKYFNADYMLMYPIDTKRQECRDKFTRGRCVVVGKDYRYVFMYFLLTDDNAKDLDKYLAQLKGMIWFN